MTHGIFVLTRKIVRSYESTREFNNRALDHEIKIHY
jgi:hypothetical protein